MASVDHSRAGDGRPGMESQHAGSARAITVQQPNWSIGGADIEPWHDTFITKVGSLS